MRLRIASVTALAAFSPAASAQGTNPFDQRVVREFDLEFTEDLFGFGPELWSFVLQGYTPGAPDAPTVLGELREQGSAETHGVEVEYRGFTTYMFANQSCGSTPKKPMKIEAIDEGWADLGQMRLNLALAWQDRSHMTEVLTRRILRRFTHAPHDAFVRLDVHPIFGQPDDFWLGMGMYLYNESIDKQFESRRLRGNDGVRFKIDDEFLGWTMPELTQEKFRQLGSGGDGPCDSVEAAYFPDWDGTLPGPDPDDDCPWEELYGIAWVIENLPPDHPSFAAEMERHLDVDQFMWTLAAWMLPGDPDRMQSRFLEDSYHGRMMLVASDVSHSFNAANISSFGNNNPLNYPVDFDQADVLIETLFTNDDYAALYAHHMRHALREGPTTADLDCIVDAYRELVTANAGEADGACIGTFYEDVSTASDPVAALAENVENFNGFGEGVPDNEPENGWLSTRAKYEARNTAMRALPEANFPEPQIVTVQQTPTLVSSGSETVVSAFAFGSATPFLDRIELRWRTRGAYERVLMVDDGTGGDAVAGDFRYSATIPALDTGDELEYYIEAYETTGNGLIYSCWPARASMDPVRHHVTAQWAESTVVINEINANGSAIGDFVEIYNRGAAAVDISGWVLNDDTDVGPDEDERFVFPDGTWIASEQHLVVWTGGEGVGWIADFGLKARGETVTLALPDGLGNAVADVVRYQRQFRDVSTGRAVDGRDAWVPMTSASPAATNGVLGDLNGDGSVTASDLTMLLGLFGQCAIDQPGDFNGDMTVDQLDVDLFLAVF